jgi:hypothetical protein
VGSDNEKFDRAVEYLRGMIRREIAAGFDPVDHIMESAVECAADGVDAAALEPLAREFTREALAEQYRAQAEWPDQTDCDRLDEAFEELESRGIVCRQNFTCCGTCGAAEIWGEMQAAETSGLPVRGYAFYHVQNTTSAVEGGGLYLHYGATDKGEEAALAVAREIVDVLTAHGLAADWNGSWRTCVGVSLDWKRRRPLEAGFGCRKPIRGLFDECE